MGNEIIRNIKYLWDSVLENIYPKEDKCPICNSYIDEGEMLCRNCRYKIRFCKSDIKIRKLNYEFICYSTAYYSDIIMELVVKLKYKSEFICGEILSMLMADYIKDRKIYFDFITFVPLSDKSFKLRGYNQSEVLAKGLSKNTGKPVLKCLKKTSETKDQIGLDEKNRWLNLSKCFCANQKITKKYIGKVILIVDDVITTGATSFYCAEALKKAGAKEVFILTAAKSKI